MFVNIYAAVVARATVRAAALKARSDRGATAVEYGLLAALIAVAIIVAVTALGTKLSTTFNSISGKIPTIS